jgi:hypothetical protein
MPLRGGRGLTQGKSVFDSLFALPDATLLRVLQSFAYEFTALASHSLLREGGHVT